MTTQEFIFFSFVKIVCVIAPLLLMVAYSVLAERRISAFIQDRVGPNRVGPAGVAQPVADILKFLLKEDYTPNHVRKVYFWLAPAIAMIPALLTFAVIPFGSRLGVDGPKMVIADLNVGILYTFGIVSLGVYGIVLAGYSAVNVLVIGLNSGNIGPLVRHRALVVPYMIWMSAAGLIAILEKGAQDVHR